MKKKSIDRCDLLIDDSMPPEEINLTPEEEKKVLEELRKSGLLKKDSK